MEIRGIEVNLKSIAVFLLHILIIADIILITVGILFELPDYISSFVLIFDLMVCIFLLTEWTVNFLRAPSKKEFLKDKENIVTFIASVPYEILFPAMIPGANLLRYIMLFKLLRIMVLYNKFFSGFKKFIRKTNLDIILGAIFFTIILFTVLCVSIGDTNNFFESLYFVIVTIATVGYGDIVPQTFHEKVVTIVLIIVGIFVVSTITAALSSYLTDRLLKSDGESLSGFKKEFENKSDEMLDEIRAVREENRQLKEEIDELKEMIKDR